MATSSRLVTALILVLTLAAAGWLLRDRLFGKPADVPVLAVAPAVPMWLQLTPAQQGALSPLQAEWNTMAAERRQKWIGVAQRYTALTPQEQVRMQDRMRKWVKLTPAQRDKARNQYRKLQTVPSDQRRELELLWREYAALSGDQKEVLKATPVTVAKNPSSRKEVRRSDSAPGVTLPKAVVMAPDGAVRPQVMLAESLLVPSSDTSAPEAVEQVIDPAQLPPQSEVSQ